MDNKTRRPERSKSLRDTRALADICSAFVAVLLFAGSLGCIKPKPVEKLDLAQVEVLAGTQRIRTDVLGRGTQFEARATFVMVEVKNHLDVDASVTLAGELIDASGKTVGALKREWLNMPAGSRRTFVLRHSERKVVDGAARAEIRVDSVTAQRQRHPIMPTDFAVKKDPLNNRLIASAWIENKGRYHARPIVLCSFYDKADRPLTRPFTVVNLDGGTRQYVSFDGPQGGESALIYIGEVAY